jgi:hypothetical protein
MLSRSAIRIGLLNAVSKPAVAACGVRRCAVRGVANSETERDDLLLSLIRNKDWMGICKLAGIVAHPVSSGAPSTAEGGAVATGAIPAVSKGPQRTQLQHNVPTTFPECLLHLSRQAATTTASNSTQLTGSRDESPARVLRDILNMPALEAELIKQLGPQMLSRVVCSLPSSTAASDLDQFTRTFTQWLNCMDVDDRVEYLKGFGRTMLYSAKNDLTRSESFRNLLKDNRAFTETLMSQQPVRSNDSTSGAESPGVPTPLPSELKNLMVYSLHALGHLKRLPQISTSIELVTRVYKELAHQNEFGATAEYFREVVDRSKYLLLFFGTNGSLPFSIYLMFDATELLPWDIVPLFRLSDLVKDIVNTVNSCGSVADKFDVKVKLLWELLRMTEGSSVEHIIQRSTIFQVRKRCL